MRLALILLVTWKITGIATQQFDLTKVLKQIESLSSNITNAVSNYNHYSYDSFQFPMSSIRDGGDDQFDDGNMVEFIEDGESYNLFYNDTIRTPDFNVTTLAINPFITLAAIRNADQSQHTFSIRVSGNLGADGNGEIKRSGGNLTRGRAVLKYYVFQVFESGDPSICEVYFMISNSDLGSVQPNSFIVEEFSTTTALSNSVLEISGTMQNVYFGYLLLSRTKSRMVAENEIENVMEIILSTTFPSQEQPNSAGTVVSTKELTTQAPRTATGVSSSVTDAETSEEDKDMTLDQFINEMLLVSSNVTTSINNFYFYEYDSEQSPMNFINSGGNHMYEYGNMLKFYEDKDMQYLMYNRSARYDRYHVGVIASHPFFTLVWIINKDKEEHNYTIQVNGDTGIVDGGFTRVFHGVLTDGRRAIVSYHAFQVYGSEDPSICEVYFTISNQGWGSGMDFAFEVVSFSKGARYLHNEVRVSGRPSNVLLGYTLLSKEKGELVTESEVRTVMDIMLQASVKVSESDLISVDFLTAFEVTEATHLATTTATTLSDNTPPEQGSQLLSLSEVWKRAVAIESDLNDVFDSWHNYIYDDRRQPINSISDGGEDMFDSGNKVRIFTETNEPPDPLLYNEEFFFPTYDVITGGTKHPFMTLAWISNENETEENYAIKVVGNLGADGSGNIATGQGSFSSSVGDVHFTFFQVFGARDASVCELYFTIARQEWVSSGQENLEMTRFSAETNAISTEVRLSGAPRNVLLGYSLLSKTAGKQIEQSEIVDFLQRLLSRIAGVNSTDIFPNVMLTTPTIAVNTQNLLDEMSDTTALFTNNTDAPLISFFTTAGTATQEPLGLHYSISALFRIIERNRENIKHSFREWYSYLYDGTDTYIQDGGNDLFDIGNKVKVFENSSKRIDVVYNETYEFAGFTFQSLAADPFISMLYVKNTDNLPVNYTIRVTGDPGSDGIGHVTNFSGTVTVGNMAIEYHSFQISGTTDPIICEVYFVIHLYNETKSIRPDAFQLDILGDGSATTNNSATISGNPSNIFFGYTLLSRFSTYALVKEDIGSFFKIAFNPQPLAFSPVITELFERIDRNRPSIISSYRDWYNYTYDGNSTVIEDGGFDIFDKGNKISVLVNGKRALAVEYDQSYSLENFDFQSQASMPFVALLLVKNSEQKDINLTLQVEGNPGADGHGSITTYSGEMEVENTLIEYHVFQISEAGDAVLCEIYFTLHNLEDDLSHPYETFEIVHFSSDTRSLENSVRITGRPHRIVMGYTLISRFPGLLISEDEVRRVLFNTFQNKLNQATESIGLPTSATRVTQISTTTQDKTTTEIVAAVTTTTTTTTTATHTTEATRIQGTLADSRSFTTTSTSDDTMTTPVPAFTTPVPTPLFDEDFLPSCSVRGVIQAVFRCEGLFASPIVYTGPALCLKKIDEVIRCVGNHLIQCRLGGGRNALDELNLRFFNSEVIISFLYNITVTSINAPTFDINAFCFHAGLNLAYPRRVRVNLDGCQRGTLHSLLEIAKTFYNRYAWARNRNDICRAFQTLKRSFLTLVSSHCDFNKFTQYGYPTLASNYIKRIATIALRSIEELDSSVCSERQEAFPFDVPGIFNRLPCPAA